MRAAKADANQKEIVQALRKAGASVQHLHRVGQGCPDILVGFRKHDFLMEIKDGSLSPSGRGLTPAQKDWHDAWRGTAYIVKSVDEALDIIYSKTQGVA